jgi:TrmH family RNA methyltransferase
MVELNDPGNMGTLMRTCAALNKKTVVCVGGVDPYHPKVVQASAGTLGLLDIFQLSWVDVVHIANTNKLSLCGLIVRGGKQHTEISFDKTLLIVGSEAHGLPIEYAQACDQTMTLSMPGKTESLNAAIAGSIALYLAWGLEHT